MQNPVNLQRDLFSFVTGGIGVGTNRTLVAAPGAGWRYRVWGWSFGYNTHAVSGAMRGLLRDGLAGTYLGHIDVTAQFPSNHEFFPGGIAMVVDTAIVGTDSSSTAAQPVNYMIYWTLEAVT